MKGRYPIIANCNYESSDDPTIHKIRLAIESGLTLDSELLSAMGRLEVVLGRDADDGSVRAQQACRDAEAMVVSAWTSAARSAIETRREARYVD